MSEEVTDLRKGERFHVLEPLDGSFNGVDVTVVNIAVGGVQIRHSQPVRIGTSAKLTFSHGEVTAHTVGHVVWSRLAHVDRDFVYSTGVQLDTEDARFALAVNSLIRAGVVQRDTDSLRRKQEREERRRSGPKPLIPPQ